MLQTRIKVAAFALLTSVVGASSAIVVDAPDAYADQARAVMSMAQASACKACEVCRSDGSGHTCNTSGSGQPYICLIHGCFDDGCDIHNSCSETRRLDERGGIQAVYAYVTHANGTKLRDYVRTLGKSAVINEARGALQLRGCGGFIIASIPLADNQLEVLTDE
jgi:hypothetical protein